MRFRSRPLILVLVLAIGVGNLNSQGLRWNANPTGVFASNTYPASTLTDFAFAHREADAMAARWNRGAKLFRVDFRAAAPLPNPGFSEHGMIEAYLYYFSPGAGNAAWNGLQVKANLSYGNGQYAVTGTMFSSNPPYPTAAPDKLVDPTEALKRLNLSPDTFLKAGVHLKAAGSPYMSVINFGSTDSPFERYIDRTVPPGKYVWWSEYHPGNLKNQYVYFDAVTGQGTAVPQV